MGVTHHGILFSSGQIPPFSYSHNHESSVEEEEEEEEEGKGQHRGQAAVVVKKSCQIKEKNI